MLQPCPNPNCSVHFALAADRCPVCGTPARPAESRTASPMTSSVHRDGDLTDTERRGKDILTIFLVLIVLFDLVASVVAVNFSGADLLSRIVRFAVTVLLCVWLYRGSIAAKRIAIGLLSLGFLLACAFIWIAQHSLITVFGGAWLLFFVAFIQNLVNSQHVNAFLAYQRRRFAGLVGQNSSSSMAGAFDTGCPMCGAKIKANAKNCSGCGESLSGARS